MKGYRTIIFNAAMTLAAGGTVQFSDLPPTAQHWLTLAVMAWGMISVFLRLITKTPIGVKAEKDVAGVERQLGLSPEDVATVEQAVTRAVSATVATMPKNAAPLPFLSGFTVAPPGPVTATGVTAMTVDNSAAVEALMKAQGANAVSETAALSPAA